jgi:hypothetical protein
MRSPMAVSRLPIVRRAVELADRRYARSRHVRELEQRIRLLEATAERSSRSASKARRLADLLRPDPGINVPLVRLGPDIDGGYVLSDDLDVDVAVSVGVGPECGADEDLARRGVEVWQFDHTVEETPSTESGIFFHKLGVASGEPDHNTRTLDDLLQMAGVREGVDTLLLMDAEGAEWGALTAASDGALERLRQIALEIHGLDLVIADDRADWAIEVLERLRRTHCLVASHGNNFGCYFNFGPILMPSVVETTWVRRDRLALLAGGRPSERSADLFPPNDPGWPDANEAGLFGASRNSKSLQMTEAYVAAMSDGWGKPTSARPSE